MIGLEDATVFNDIRERLAQITDDQIAAAERRLSVERPRKKNSDNGIVGRVDSPVTRALFTLYCQLDNEEDLERALARQALDEIAEKDHNERSVTLGFLASAVAQLFWAQAKIDIAFYERADVSLRAGWMMVRLRDSGPQAMLASLMRGGPPEEE